MVTEPANNPFKMWRIEHGVLTPLVDSGIPEQYNQPRQALPTAYWQIGTLDVIRTPTITELGSMSGRRILPLVVGPELAEDIDDERSFRAAEEASAEAGSWTAAVRVAVVGTGSAGRRPIASGAAEPVLDYEEER